MDEIIEHLKLTLTDEVFSKAERKSLRALLDENPLTDHQLNFVRSKIYELAHERANPENYKFVLDWIKNANSALITNSVSASDAYFSPGEECRNVIIHQIKSAIQQLQICVFTISDDLITDAIITSHQRGTTIRIITDNDKSLDEGSDIEHIVKQGIAVKMDRTPNHMHHKFMVVDGKALITGSYNWTRSAARFNHENVLLTKDAGVVKSFLKEFDQLWQVMETY
jgi:phosphatidylserine/phosphatidylglycerophosphate/cardiolipin synthase-like enzyme